MYADLHCHSSAKPFLSAVIPDKKISPWPSYSGSVPQIFYPIIGSQSSLKQLSRGKVNLAVITIVPFEKALANFWMIRDVVTSFTILDRPTLQQISKENVSYNQIFWQEVNYLFKHRKHENKQLNIMRSIEDFIDEENVINAIIAIEGSHMLFDENNEPKDPLLKLSQVKKAKDFSALYLTMAHLSQNDFCNHARGMKISRNKDFDPSLHTKGLNKEGLAIIEECYSRKNGKRILIDIKHMSLYARLQFYQFRQENGYQNVPIIASHMGLTGYSYAKIEQKLKSSINNSEYTVLTYQDQNPAEVTFNPLSINLYDEEVLEIINSGGLLGLSLDKRILGKVGRNARESISQKEWDEISGMNQNGIPQLEHDFIRLGSKAKQGLRHLCLHIIHIIKLCGSKGWQHICLGTDFDGLIDPINSCKNASCLPQLEEDLLREMQLIIEESNIEIPHENLDQHIRDFMYNNLSNFMKRCFSSQYLNG